MAGVQSKTVNYGETASVITTRSEERRTLETGGWAGAARMGNYRPWDHQHQPATPPPALLPSWLLTADRALVVIAEFQLETLRKCHFFQGNYRMTHIAKYGKVSKSDLYLGSIR